MEPEMGELITLLVVFVAVIVGYLGLHAYFDE